MLKEVFYPVIFFDKTLFSFNLYIPYPSIASISKYKLSDRGIAVQGGLAQGGGGGGPCENKNEKVKNRSNPVKKAFIYSSYFRTSKLLRKQIANALFFD